jgi:hypothetical protein
MCDADMEDLQGPRARQAPGTQEVAWLKQSHFQHLEPHPLGQGVVPNSSQQPGSHQGCSLHTLLTMDSQ